MSNTGAPQPLTSHRAERVTGDLQVPGDKSISHRSLIFGALAIGETTIQGLLDSEDVINTARALSAMGAPITEENGIWRVKGSGIGGLQGPDGPLDFGNSGTGVRLMMGLIAGHDMSAHLMGDASLSKRPMSRVLEPLRGMGLAVEPQSQQTLPLTVRGTQDLIPITYELPVASAQVKSAVLIAGLHAVGATTVIEPVATRDHTERMLVHFGAAPDVVIDATTGARHITVVGRRELTARDVIVPGDPSSAAFLVVAALLVPDSDLLVRGVLVNETRVGLYTTLVEMGADLTFENTRIEAGEPVADLRARSSSLHAVTVPAARAPSMIDEYPVLAVAAAQASGTTRMEGLHELTVKESDRLMATAAMLDVNGAAVMVEGDTLSVTGVGTDGRVPGGGRVETHLDHRIAMAALVLGLTTEAPVAVDDAAAIATSFPSFRDLMTSAGGVFSDGDAR